MIDYQATPNGAVGRSGQRFLPMDQDGVDIVGNSPALSHVLRQVEISARTDSTILILGETGTGKELIARAIHRFSSRRDRAFIRADCASLPAGLIESELFGHERGAFTGAVVRNIGRFELAHEGTLFLDEVGDVPLELQSKLLRVLQEQELERLGSARTIRVDFRLVAATNRNLARMIDDGQFRTDLYYRLNVFPIELPPLRDRKEDVPFLIRHFVDKYARRMNKRIDSIPSEDMETLCRYQWPGNIRELQNVIERCVILSAGPALHRPQLPQQKPVGRTASPEFETLADVERRHILRILRETEWVIGGIDGAAARLGVKRTTLLDKMRRLGISRQAQ
ncbi:MAG TPA: sigma 54-interacting transcriptional regulator [Candidatus Acidoferrales bacterium]|nr:sigma 54-interacting transcriptional regulator [Candidatus Acidoferrales bacterium]